MAVASAILVVAVAGLVAIKPFFGEVRRTPKQPHEAPFAMLVGPAVLSLLALIFGVVPLCLPALYWMRRFPTSTAVQSRPLWHFGTG